MTNTGHSKKSEKNPDLASWKMLKGLIHARYVIVHVEAKRCDDIKRDIQHFETYVLNNSTVIKKDSLMKLIDMLSVEHPDTLEKYMLDEVFREMTHDFVKDTLLHILLLLYPEEVRTFSCDIQESKDVHLGNIYAKIINT